MADPLTIAIEAAAAVEHERWSKWMRYLFQCSTRSHDGTATIPKDKTSRWTRQMHTPYRDLSEAEKESDRAEARQSRDAILSALRDTYGENAYLSLKDGSVVRAEKAGTVVVRLVTVEGEK